MSRGGYQEPRNPAPASGPGSLSRRTDGRQAVQAVPDAEYGEQKAYREQQQGAAVAQSNPVGDSAAAQPAPVQVVPMGADSQMPNVPITDGAPTGPGAGLASLGLIDPEMAARTEDLQYAAQYLPYFEYLASRPDSTPGMRQTVRRLKGLL